MVRLRKSFLAVSMLNQEQRELAKGTTVKRSRSLPGGSPKMSEKSRFEPKAMPVNAPCGKPWFPCCRISMPRGITSIFACRRSRLSFSKCFSRLAAQDNLRAVLDYEIERQLPFKRDEIYYDYLPGGKKGEKLSIYVFAIPKKSLDVLLTMLESLGITPNGVETTVTALANYVLFTDETRASGAAVIAGHPNHWELVGVEAKTHGWSSTAELLFSHRLPTAAWAQNAGQELLQKCLKDVPKVFHCGDLAALNGAVQGKLEQAEDFVGRVNPRLGDFKTSSQPGQIPAIGAALHGVREGLLRVNFLRHEAADAKGINNLSILNTVLLVLLAISLIAWCVSFPIKDELRLRQLRRENMKLAPAVDALRREDEEFERLRKEQSFLNGLEQRRGEVLRVLDELSKIIPNSAYLSNLRYRSGVLEIQGSAENASALIPLLERSPVFESVGFNAPSNRGRDNRETFSLKADLEKSKESAKDLKGGATMPPAKSEKAKP